MANQPKPIISKGGFTVQQYADDVDFRETDALAATLGLTRINTYTLVVREYLPPEEIKITEWWQGPDIVGKTIKAVSSEGCPVYDQQGNLALPRNATWSMKVVAPSPDGLRLQVLLPTRTYPTGLWVEIAQCALVDPV